MAPHSAWATALGTLTLVLVAGGVATARADDLAPQRSAEQLVQRGEVVRVVPADDGRALLLVRSRGGDRTYLLGPGVRITTGVSSTATTLRAGLLTPGDRVSVVATPAGEVTRVVERQRRPQVPGARSPVSPPGVLVP